MKYEFVTDTLFLLQIQSMRSFLVLKTNNDLLL